MYLGAAVVVAALAAAAVRIVRRHQLRASIPEVALADAESQVAAKIRRCIEKVQKKPRSARAWGLLGMNLHVHEYLEQAGPCYRTAHRMEPETFAWPYYLAVVLQKRNAPEALEWLRTCEAYDGFYPMVQVRLGTELYKRGELKDAALVFRRVLNHHEIPRFTRYHAHTGLAQVELDRDNLDVGKRHCEEALKAVPDGIEALRMLVDVHRRLGNEKQRRAYSLALDQLPEAKTHTPLADDFMIRLHKEGVSSYWYEGRGKEYLLRGNLEKGAAELRKALRLKPSIGVFQDLFFALIGLERFDEADSVASEGLRHYPDNAHMLTCKGTALIRKGAYQEGIDYYRRAMSADSTYLLPARNLGKHALRHGDFDRARRAFEHALRVDSSSWYARMQLAWILAVNPAAEQRRPGRARSLMESVHEIPRGMRPPRLYDVMGAVYAADGDFDRAVSFADTALVIARARADTVLAADIAARKKLYRRRTPFTAAGD